MPDGARPSPDAHLQCAATRRAPERGDLLHPQGSPGSHRIVALPLQRDPPTWQPGIPAAGAGDDRHAKLAARLRYAPPAAQLGRKTGNALTFDLDQSTGAGQEFNLQACPSSHTVPRRRWGRRFCSSLRRRSCCRPSWVDCPYLDPAVQATAVGRPSAKILQCRPGASGFCQRGLPQPCQRPASRVASGYEIFERGFPCPSSGVEGCCKYYPENACHLRDLPGRGAGIPGDKVPQAVTSVFDTSQSGIPVQLWRNASSQTSLAISAALWRLDRAGHRRRVGPPYPVLRFTPGHSG